MLGIRRATERDIPAITQIYNHAVLNTVATDMTKGARNWDAYTKPAEAAAGLIAQMDRLDAATPPEFRHQDGTLLPHSGGEPCGTRGRMA